MAAPIAILKGEEVDVLTLAVAPNVFVHQMPTSLGVVIIAVSESSLYLVEFNERPSLRLQLESLTRAPGASITKQQRGHRECGRPDERVLQGGASGVRATPGSARDPAAAKTSGNGSSRSRTAPPPPTTRWCAISGALELHVRSAEQLAKNLLAVIVPCDRVLVSNGALTGDAAGTRRKRWLLEHESYR